MGIEVDNQGEGGGRERLITVAQEGEQGYGKLRRVRKREKEDEVDEKAELCQNDGQGNRAVDEWSKQQIIMYSQQIHLKALEEMEIGE